MDLVPAVRGVVDPGADDLDPLPDVRNQDTGAVPGDDLENERAADAGVAGRKQAVLARVELQLDVDVAVVELGLDLLDGADGDVAAAFHLQPVRVVDADKRRPRTAVRRRRRTGLAQEAAAGDERDDDEREHSAHPSHPARALVSAKDAPSATDLGGHVIDSRRGRGANPGLRGPGEGNR